MLLGGVKVGFDGFWQDAYGRPHPVLMLSPSKHALHGTAECPILRHRLWLSSFDGLRTRMK
ncbi:MAG: hypothetical protein K0S54_980 [Alphaproteobacteria bacterium]|jgi:hypothetical protein|nr:hypothetical protein [Alphaproteobacteria bacterium]